MGSSPTGPSSVSFGFIEISFVTLLIMQKQSKSRLYKKLLICSIALFGLGLLLAFISLSSLYGEVNKCGFGTGVNHFATVVDKSVEPETSLDFKNT